MSDEIMMYEYVWDGDEEGGGNEWTPINPQPSCRNCEYENFCSVKKLVDMEWFVSLDEFFCMRWRRK